MSIDLNVCFETEAALETAKDLGYLMIALSRSIPASSDLRSLSFPTIHSGSLSITVLRRVTLIISSVSQISVLSQLYTARKDFDIIAARPVNDTVLKALCEKGLCDLISLDPSCQLLSSSSRSAIKSAIDRGISIEVEFGPCLRDMSIRTSMVSQCKQYLSSFTKGVFVSSGARNVLEMRSALDLSNFANCVLGLKTNSAKEASECLSKALKRSGIAEII